ncbi:hypothetical protein C7419_103299 [Cupriavidus plantarum]|uniref:Uncharacterized protein n=1 Tax=Cupriavidus plantarum TaxID=942865 RepID=A0A316EQ68_9BURK|nr:hypothetical protein C7419_103299 [Cupriavidus plantarum]
MRVTICGPLAGQYGLRVTHAGAEQISRLQAMAFESTRDAIMWVSENCPTAELSMLNLSAPGGRTPSKQ